MLKLLKVTFISTVFPRNTAFDDIYMVPWCRMGPYIIGICTGYILYRTDCKVRLRRVSMRHWDLDPLSYFLFQPIMLHDWYNSGMCYPVCGMVHIKEPLLLIGKSSPCGGSGFPLSLSEWSFTICMTPYKRN